MSFKFVIVVILMLATLGVLISGLVLMAVDGNLNTKYANRLMVARVVLQGLAVGMLALIAMS